MQNVRVEMQMKVKGLWVMGDGWLGLTHNDGVCCVEEERTKKQKEKKKKSTK